MKAKIVILAGLILASFGVSRLEAQGGCDKDCGCFYLTHRQPASAREVYTAMSPSASGSASIVAMTIHSTTSVPGFEIFGCY